MGKYRIRGRQKAMFAMKVSYVVFRLIENMILDPFITTTSLTHKHSIEYRVR